MPIVGPVTMISWKRLALNVLEDEAYWHQLLDVFDYEGSLAVVVIL